MVIWSGMGFLVAVVVFGCSLGMELITESATGDDQFYQNSVWALPLALMAAAAITFFGDALLWAKAPGEHSLFFIPMRWWAPILAIISIGTFGYNVVGG